VLNLDHAHKPGEWLLANLLLLLNLVLGEAHAVAGGHPAHAGELGLQLHSPQHEGAGDLAIHLR
jgi:hypothetical protein